MPIPHDGSKWRNNAQRTSSCPQPSYQQRANAYPAWWKQRAQQCATHIQRWVMMGNDEHDLATHIQRLGNYIHLGNKSKDEKALHPRSSLGKVMEKKHPRDFVLWISGMTFLLRDDFAWVISESPISFRWTKWHDRGADGRGRVFRIRCFPPLPARQCIWQWSSAMHGLSPHRQHQRVCWWVR